MRDELIIHGGVVFESVINYLDKFGPEILVIQFGFLVILSTIFLWLWFSNRRKYHNLKHAIPANIVKSYLDSIIQNSTSLKSQLFRGGGLDLGSVPSVMPLHNLVGGEGLAVSGAPSTALMEELNQRTAQIAALNAQLSSATVAQREVENKLGQSQGNLQTAEAKIKELEALLTQGGKANNAGVSSSSGGSNDAALKAELSNVTKERDDLRDRLREFEIIADDLANLKRLQQENDQLKKSLAAQGGKPVAAAAEPAPQEVPKNILSQADVSDLFEDLGKQEAANTAASDNSALEEFLSSPTDTDTAFEDAAAALEAEDPMIAASEDSDSSESNKPKSEKTPEDLLSEFEKMLG